MSERGYEGPPLRRGLAAQLQRARAQGFAAQSNPFSPLASSSNSSPHGFAVDDKDLRERHAGLALVDGELNLRGGLVLRIALNAEPSTARSSAIARKSTPTLSMSTAPALTMSPDFWEPIHARPDKRLILDPDEFYILASREKLHIPADLAAEMVPIDPAMGEFRVHYAGFFDPGFG